MKHIRQNIDRWFMGYVCIFILSQFCIVLKDARTSDMRLEDGARVSRVVNPKGYFISKIAPLFKNRELDKNTCIEEKINMVFQELGIKARLVENTIRFCNGSFEFLVSVPAYKKDFLFRYTPLLSNLAELIQTENFKLEVKIFSGWMPITLERLFG